MYETCFRKEALRRCEELGFDISEPRIGFKAIKDVTEVFLQLLQSKIRIDKSCLAATGGEFSESHRAKLNARVTSEYKYFHELLLNAIESHYGGYVIPDVPGGNMMTASVDNESSRDDWLLGPFERGWRDIKHSLDIWTWEW